ncbi:MAG: aminodeoxychorismate lyase [Lachnospiraceae bacterium]|nr:aminodeoxychorismate lyase [Lachnospiraceae bacterium]
MDGGRITGTIAGTLIKIAILIVMVFGIYKMAIGAYEFGYRVFAEPAMSEEPGITISVSITEDMDTMAVGKLLESKGLIRDARLFYVQEIVSEYKDKIQPGIFELKTSMTAEEILTVLGANSDDASETEEIEE